MHGQTQYDLISVKLPRLAGKALDVFAMLVENPTTRGLLIGSLLQNAGVTSFRKYHITDAPAFAPNYSADEVAPILAQGDFSSRLDDLAELPAKPKGFAYKTIMDYRRAYLDGATDPEGIADKVLQAIESCQKDNPKLNIFIAWDRDDLLAQAHASHERYRKGEPIGPLDGVPVAIKDEVDMVPFPTTVGTRILGRTAAKQDSTVVARMRAAGALLIGKANMHEIGIGVTGLNPHYGTVRNPYHPDHHTGGSSSGPAAAVASGICPVAIGADGGGSIRIPASFCGIVGIKPTYGRVSEFGAAALTWSMGHLGPLASTTLDACLAYSIIAGPDPCDSNSLHHPPVHFDRLTELDLSDITLGVYWPWFHHAQPEIVKVCEDMLHKLQESGARVKEIEVPNLEPARVAHLIIIVSEMLTAIGRDYDAHRREFALDTRLNLALAQTFTSQDYVHAQQIRNQAIAGFQNALRDVDAIITPATGITAPPIRADAQPNGESDLTQLSEIMRFVPFSNLTGHPAISFPAGYSEEGLPIGLQAIGRPWEEHLLFRLAYAAEQCVERKPPKIRFSILPGS